MNEKFFEGFCDELEKVAISPGLLAKAKGLGAGALAKLKSLPAKLRKGAKIGKWSLLGLLGYSGIKAGQGLQEAKEELKREGHI